MLYKLYWINYIFSHLIYFCTQKYRHKYIIRRIAVSSATPKKYLATTAAECKLITVDC